MRLFAILTGRPERFSAVADALAGAAGGANVDFYSDAAAALQAAADASLDLMVVDERLDGLAATVFLKRLMEVNAMIDTAVASPLPTEQFHENYEGLGVLMQLPPEPDRFSAEDLLERMRSLNGAWSGGLEDKS